jgi:hypothetical protein
MPLYRNTLPTRLVIGPRGKHNVNPAGSKFLGEPTDIVDIAEADLDHPSIAPFLGKELEKVTAPTLAEKKAPASAPVVETPAPVAEVATPVAPAETAPVVEETKTEEAPVVEETKTEEAPAQRQGRNRK